MNESTNYIIRPLQAGENHLLRNFLYEAIYIPEGVEPPSKDVVELPELKVYIENFGKKISHLIFTKNLAVHFYQDYIKLG